jgi:hypothetical protein
MDWINVAQNRKKYLAVLNLVINIRVECNVAYVNQLMTCKYLKTLPALCYTSCTSANSSRVETVNYLFNKNDIILF